jgi:hypothetical protein
MTISRTPVYRAQTITFSLAQQLEGDWRLLRVLKAYRSAAALQIRQLTADAARAGRKSGSLAKLGPPRNVVTAMPPLFYS